MFHVVEFNNNSVAVLPDKWMSEPGVVTRPPVKSQKKLDKLVDDEETPDEGWTEYAVKVHKSTANLDLARKLQKILEELSEVPSTDETFAMYRGNKRIPKTNMPSDFTDEKENQPPLKKHKVEVDYLPPPPPLLDMSNFDCDMDLQPAASSSLVKPLTTPPIIKQQNTISEHDHIVDILAGISKKMEFLCAQIKDMQSDLRSLKYQLATAKESEVTSPVQLPIDNLDDLQMMNEKLRDQDVFQRMLTFLKAVGGSSYGDCTFKIMCTLVTDRLAIDINWRGVNNKTSIAGSPLAALVVEAVMSRKYPDSTHSKVKEKIQRWIQRARRRHPDFQISETKERVIDVEELLFDD